MPLYGYFFPPEISHKDNSSVVLRHPNTTVVSITESFQINNQCTNSIITELGYFTCNRNQKHFNKSTPNPWNNLPWINIWFEGRGYPISICLAVGGREEKEQCPLTANLPMVVAPASASNTLGNPARIWAHVYKPHDGSLTGPCLPRADEMAQEQSQHSCIAVTA